MEKKCMQGWEGNPHKEQSDDIGTETVTAWVGLIWLRGSIRDRLF